MPSMIPCPKCGEYSYHKSHNKNTYEIVRKRFFQQRPYRCHSCGFRGWVSRSALKPRITRKQILIYIGVFIVAILFSMILKNFLS